MCVCGGVLCAHVHVCVVYVHICVKARGGHQIFSFIIVSRWPQRQAGSQQAPDTVLALIIPVELKALIEPSLAFYISAGDLNSGPSASASSVLTSSAISLVPSAYFL